MVNYIVADSHHVRYSPSATGGWAWARRSMSTVLLRWFTGSAIMRTFRQGHNMGIRTPPFGRAGLMCSTRLGVFNGTTYVD